ncbi:HNH endonuclease family protein [Crossiella equi]|uniref:HNH endonuclease family protein n=1 Tax=Crossiella equi TaxID=130796 RepID=UPI00117870A1|nr:HNH endonuclease family protein [Crossiella equi]
MPVPPPASSGAQGQPGAAGVRPKPEEVGQARTELGKLKVVTWAPMKGYSREKFKHWTSQGESCDTREFVLRREGEDVTTDKSCKVLSGKWRSAYDDKVLTGPGELDIDHTVPLANAWRTGAAEWTDERRSEFANDTRNPQLLAVSAASNRSKGDQDPSQWKPPATGVWCGYAVHWIKVKAVYSLGVTEAERTALTDMLGHCK